MRRFLLLGVVLVAACATTNSTVVQYRGDDGKFHRRIDIECRDNEADCLVEAGEQCQHGYVVEDKAYHSGGMCAYGHGGAFKWYTMSIYCKRAKDD